LSTVVSWNEVLRYIAKQRTVTRSEIARQFGISYWRARYRLDKFALEGILEKNVITWLLRRRITYALKRIKERYVGSFRFGWIFRDGIGKAQEYFRNMDDWEGYKKTLGSKFHTGFVRDRAIEIVVEVDKPAWTELAASYVFKVLIDYSHHSFTYGGFRAKSYGKTEFAGQKYWVEGKDLDRPSGFFGEEVWVKIYYTDYNYKKGWSASNTFNALDQFEPSSKVKNLLLEKVIGWIIETSKEKFKW